MKHTLQAVIPFEAIALYPFAFFDEILEARCNPGSIYYQAPSAADRPLLEAEATAESVRIYRVLREQTFSLQTASQICPVVEQYLQAIDELGAQAWQDHQASEESGENAALLLSIIRMLSELKTRILHRYEKVLPESRAGKPGKAAVIAKLICKLSADQIGIILRAADDNKIVLSKSISLIYKTLIPYLATTQRSELSWQSVRSSSYHPGEGDKAAAIAALEAMVDTIRGYH